MCDNRDTQNQVFSQICSIKHPWCKQIPMAIALLSQYSVPLTDSCWRMHECVSKLCSVNYAITGSDIGLSPVRYQAIMCSNTGWLLIIPLGTNLISVKIKPKCKTFLFQKKFLKMSSAQCQPFCLHLNVLIKAQLATMLLRLLGL